MGFSAYVEWYGVLLLDIGSSGSHPLDPIQHYLLRALDASVLSLRPCGKMNEGIKSPSLMITPNNKMFGFFLSQYMFWEHNKPMVVLCLLSELGRNLSHLRKTKACSIGELA